MQIKPGIVCRNSFRGQFKVQSFTYIYVYSQLNTYNKWQIYAFKFLFFIGIQGRQWPSRQITKRRIFASLLLSYGKIGVIFSCVLFQTMCCFALIYLG